MTEFLKCDAAGCGHIETMETITADMVGKPCPKCGSSLLTEHDYEVYTRVYRPTVERLVAAGIVTEAPHDVPPEHRVTVNYHDGELRIGLPRGGKAA